MKKRADTDYIYLKDGSRLLPEKIRPQDISIDHILDGLSSIKRFNGQTSVSVLRHSIAIALHFPAGSTERRVALFHDAAEAYLLDIPVPLKRFTNAHWTKTYGNIEEAICKTFDLPKPGSRAWKRVKKVDKAVVPYEMSIDKMRGEGQMEFPGGYQAKLKDHMELHSKYCWYKTEEQLPLLFKCLFYPLTIIRYEEQWISEGIYPGMIIEYTDKRRPSTPTPAPDYSRAHSPAFHIAPRLRRFYAG